MIDLKARWAGCKDLILCKRLVFCNTHTSITLFTVIKILLIYSLTLKTHNYRPLVCISKPRTQIQMHIQ